MLEQGDSDVRLHYFQHCNNQEDSNYEWFKKYWKDFLKSLILGCLLFPPPIPVWSGPQLPQNWLQIQEKEVCPLWITHGKHFFLYQKLLRCRWLGLCLILSWKKPFRHFYRIVKYELQITLIIVLTFTFKNTMENPYWKGRLLNPQYLNQSASLSALCFFCTLSFPSIFF